MSCLTPAWTTPSVSSLSINVGSLFSLIAVESFYAYDAAAINVSSVFPGGGAYNLQTDIVVSGAFLNFGAIRCQFGDASAGLISSYGEYINTTHIRMPDRNRVSSDPLR